MRVSIQKIAKYAQHFDLFVLHEAQMALPFRDALEGVFRTVVFKTIEELQTEGTTYQCHLLILCISLEALKNSALKSTVLKIQTLETALFTPDTKSLAMYKAALSLRGSNLSAIPQNSDELTAVLMSIFSTLVKKHNESVLSNYERMISESSETLFWIHKEEKVVYANETLKRRFGTQGLVELERSFGDKEMTPLLKSSVISQKVIPKKDKNGTEKEYLVTNQPLKNGEYLVSMTPLFASLESGEKQLLNRMGFIDLLQEAFTLQKGDNSAIPVLVMFVNNADKIIETHGEEVYNNVCKEMSQLAKLYFDHDVQIGQWHKDIFTVIGTKITLDELKTMLERFHERLGGEFSADGAYPIIDSFVIDMHGVELNKAIGIIDHINQKQLLSSELAHLVHFEISAASEEVDDKKQAIYYLEKMIMTKTAVKLLNFYKGIRISTAAQIVKISGDMVYVSVEKIQGYAMKLEGTVVIQGSNIPYDIAATVKIVDIAKKIAVLSNFEPLQASGNNRQYIRIQSDHRMHVTIATAKSVISGTILDVSIKSIACRLSTLKVPLKLNSKVSLQFNLPLERFDGGMVTMAIAGRVQYIQEGDEFTKVVVELDLMEPYESYLIEYIYARQQALVNEIKTIANKL
jgi:GGDEF domain-containing protein